MNQIIETSYNTTKVPNTKTLYNICVESKQEILQNIFDRYKKPVSKFMYGDTKDELIQDVKSYADYNLITSGIFSEYMELVYKGLKGYTEQITTNDILLKPKTVIYGFIEEMKSTVFQWQKEVLLPAIADMATGNKKEYDTMIEEAYRECVGIMVRAVAVDIAIVLENFEEYLFDQMDDKENRDPETMFVMSTLHSYITERISLLSDLSIEATKNL